MCPHAHTLLYARSIPSVGGHTEIADEHAAYDALPEEMKRRIASLVVEHSIFNSRARLGFSDFSEEERHNVTVAQVLVRIVPEIRAQVPLPGLPCGAHLRNARARRASAH